MNTVMDIFFFVIGGRKFGYLCKITHRKDPANFTCVFNQLEKKKFNLHGLDSLKNDKQCTTSQGH